MVTNEVYELSNGVKIPRLMLGKRLLNNDEAEAATKTAIKLDISGLIPQRLTKMKRA